MSESQGRPTAAEQLALQKNLREYYEKGISATATANRLDVNVKTVCKYFKQWSNEINELTSKKFKEQIIENKAQHLMVLDKQLQYLYYLQEEMRDQTHVINSMSGSRYNFNFRERLATTKMILDIMEKRDEILGLNENQKLSSSA